jgi:hypothetical protein
VVWVWLKCVSKAAFKMVFECGDAGVDFFKWV